MNTTFDDLYAEIAQHYAQGRILVAIDGSGAESTRRFAEALADAARATGRSAFHASAERPEIYDTGDDASLLRAVLARFRDGALDHDGALVEVPSTALLVVDGRFLLSPRLRGAWHFRVWIDGEAALTDLEYAQRLRYVRDEDPRGAAEATFDISKPGAPVRTFSDSC